MNAYSAFHPAPVARVHLAALIAFLTAGSMILLHADTAPGKLTFIRSTNEVSAPAAPDTALVKDPTATNAPSTVKISDSDDDDADGFPDAKGHDHNTVITIGDPHGNSKTLLGNVIPLTSILCVFGCPVLIVFFVFYFRYRRRRENLALAREFLNKGMPVPPELFDESLRSDAVESTTPLVRGCSDRRRGIRYLAIGLGISLALYFGSPRSHDWAWGLILAVMGLGYLFSGWIDGRDMPTSVTPPLPPLPPIPPNQPPL